MDRKTSLVFALLSLLQACAVTCNCRPSLPNNSLTCYNDYNHTITCVWDSTYQPESIDTMCTVHAERVDDRRYFPYSNSCKLEPVDIYMPAVKKCSIIFESDYIFQYFHILGINVSCNGKQIVNISYIPHCNIKVNPPEKPEINYTTVLSEVTEHLEVTLYRSELQWKQHNQQWTDLSPEQNLTVDCESQCKTDLNEDWLIKGEHYDVRVRVRSMYINIPGTWSDWSPTTSWVSPIGKKSKPKPQPDVDFLHIIVAGVAVFALVLAIIVFKTDKTSWVYIVKKIKGQPVPNPANSFLRDATFKTFSTPHFNTKSFHSLWEPVEIVSEEVTFMVDAIAPHTPEAKKMKSEGNHESTSSSFTNPSYSELCSTPLSMLTAGNLEPCAADSTYGPVGETEGKIRNQEDHDRSKAIEKDMEILKMLCKGSSDSAVLVISDYEKVEKIQAERLRLQSLESGISCVEEVSQNSMEADSINLGEEGTECVKGKKGENVKKPDFLKLFGGSGGTFGVKSIQVCSDYQSVQKLPVDSPELPSLDSGVSSGGEEQVSQEESMDDVDKSTESTRFLFPTHPSIALPCSLPSSSQLPVNIPSLGLSATSTNQVLEKFALMTACRSVEPSGDGYMPVRQEQG